MKINMKKVWGLYPKVICIEEYYTPAKKWTNVLPDGTFINDINKYFIHPQDSIFKTVKDEDFDMPRQRVVIMCIEQGATRIQFRRRDEKGELCYPDYSVEELIIK